MKQKHYLYLFAWLLLTMASCKKFLDEPPLDSSRPPKSLEDLQALLDNKTIMNDKSTQLNELVADNYYVNDNFYNQIAGSASFFETDNYRWYDSAFNLQDWKNQYQGPIYYANIVLDDLKNINSNDNKLLWETLKGSALFYRAFAFERLAQLYCWPYRSSANTDLGIVLKITSSINEPIKRSTVQQTYDQIIGDLKAAADFLPVSSGYVTRPNKVAAYAALARTYLSMSDSVNAGLYADMALKLNSQLMNFNSLLAPGTRISSSNSENIYYSHTNPAGILMSPFANIDSTLYHSYNDNDCRKTVFFFSKGAGQYGFKGSYAGGDLVDLCFDGFTTGELYLIRAECYARNGNVNAAMQDLNHLLATRWKNNGSWQPLQAANKKEAIDLILQERRKELVYRGTRWSDLRRLNLTGANTSLRRKINGAPFELHPGDLKWVLLIPQEVIDQSKLEQNKR